jgi:hypothetical protein
MNNPISRAKAQRRKEKSTSMMQDSSLRLCAFAREIF